MRIGIISDIHGNIYALERVLEDMQNRGVEKIFCCGDILAFGPHPLKVFERITSLKNITIIRGNTDRWLEMVSKGINSKSEKVIERIRPTLEWTLEKLGDKTNDFFSILKESFEWEYEGSKIFIRHGSLESDTEGIYPEGDLSQISENCSAMGCDVFLCGHTHIPFVAKSGKVLFINDGSVSLPFDGIPVPSWAILEKNKMQWEAQIIRTPDDRNALIKDLENSNMPLKEIWIDRIKRARM